jgi:hypothetical protein
MAPAGGVGWQFRQPSDEFMRDGVSRGVQPSEIGSSLTTVESLCAHAKHGGGRRERFRVLGAGELERLQLGRGRDEGEEPVQLVGKGGERDCLSGRARWSMLRAEEAPAQIVDRLTGDACSVCELFLVRVQEVRHDAERVGGRAMKVGTPPGGPEEHEGADPRAGGEAPAFEAVRNRRVRRRNRHRQDKRQERSRRGRCEVAADHAREESAEADDRHCACGEPRISRTQRPDRDVRRADASQPEVRDQATPPRATELDQHEQRERSEGREDRRLGLPDDLVRERKDGRHHDRGTRGALQRCDIHGWR